MAKPSDFFQIILKNRSFKYSENLQYLKTADSVSLSIKTLFKSASQTRAHIGTLLNKQFQSVNVTTITSPMRSLANYA